MTKRGALYQVLAFLFSLTVGIFLIINITPNIFEYINENTEGVTDRDVYKVESVSFEGELSIWADRRKVKIYTEGGTFIYPENTVSYEVVTGDEFKVEIIKHSLGNEVVFLSIGDEKIKKVRTDFAEQFKSNIKIRESS